MAIWSNGRHLVFLLVLLTVSYVIGIFVFTQGFLLNRLVIPKQSSCEDSLRNLSSRFSHQENIGACWMRARFKKSIIIVIDALRHDFMLYNESLADQDAENYQNKLKVLHEILKTKPDHGKVFKFVADPPTTTMQRIKGLTTGSLPTFIDAGSNFASSEILEDNIISQLKSLGKNLVFMGDDTWMGLFPNSFERHYPFPSFNVKDLHTVDNGVISHLLPEIRKQDWDIIIAHFLGVDHCGHRHGPYHPAMAEKLTQMDVVLRSVISELDNDTVLLVFGDHGMTKTGDHGGDSEDEVYAGLFVYSSTKLFAHQRQSEEDLVVFQTDIVPTLSLLLGAPIPFGNLGIVITSLFEEVERNGVAEEERPPSLQALQLNARQVHRYVNQYSKLSSDISLSALENLKKMFSAAEQQVPAHFENMEENAKSFQKNMTLAKKKYLVYLREVRELCRSVWAKYDLVAITAGISLVGFSCLVSIVIIISQKMSPNLLVLQLTRYNFFALLLMVSLCGLLFCCGYTRISLAVCFASGTVLFLTRFREMICNLLHVIGLSWNLRAFVITLVLVIYFFGFFSNSFVVHEDKGVLFLLQTSLLIGCFDMLRNSYVFSKFSELDNPRPVSWKLREKADKKWTAIHSRRFVLKLSLLMILLVQTRFGEIFWFCREEQGQCASSFVKPSNMLPSNESQSGYQFWLSSVLLCLVPASLSLWLKSCGNLNGHSCTVLSTKYVLPLGSFFVCLHWFLQFVPSKMLEQTPVIGLLQQILTPCAVYFCSALTLLCLIYKPLTIYFAGTHDVFGKTTNTRGNRPAVNTVVEIFNRLRSEMSVQNSGESEKLPVVYGLGTVYSSAISILLVCLATPLAMLLGDGLASSVALMLMQIYGFLELYSGLTFREAVEEENAGFLVYPVITWFLMSSHYFFSSGHQATIPSIRFEAAFVGLPGDMGNVYLPGFLILLNTFASDVIFATSLPLIMFWSKKVSHEKNTADTDDRNKEEFVYAESPDRLHSETFRLCALYQVCKGFKLLGTMLAAAIHRRHLMVWKIFAPRFIFEAVSFNITSVMLISVFCFILRLDSTLKHWRHVLENALENKDEELDG